MIENIVAGVILVLMIGYIVDAYFHLGIFDKLSRL